MTKAETLKVLVLLKSAYPASYRGISDDEAHVVVNLWSTMFADVPVDIVMLAVRKHISVGKYAPTIAEIRAQIRSIGFEAAEMIAQRTALSDVDRQRLLMVRDGCLKDTAPTLMALMGDEDETLHIEQSSMQALPT